MMAEVADKFIKGSGSDEGAGAACVNPKLESFASKVDAEQQAESLNQKGKI